MFNKDKIKAILLDVDNTLLCFQKNATKAVRDAFINNGLEFKDEYMSTFFEINSNLWKQLDEGQIDRGYLHYVRFKKIFEKLQIEGDFLSLERDFRKFFSTYYETVDGAYELVEYLSKKYKLYVASNATYDVQINRLNKSGLIKYFDNIFISEKIGKNKPARQFFEVCFENIKERPEDCVMIGDSLNADIKGAKQFGINTIWLNRFLAPLPKENICDVVVDNLQDIMKIL